MSPKIALSTLVLYLPESQTLKDKRAVIKSLLKRLHNTFNVSAAEIGELDKWQKATIAVVVVSNEARHAHDVLQQAVHYIETHYPQLQILDETFEAR